MTPRILLVLGLVVVALLIIFNPVPATASLAPSATAVQVPSAINEAIAIGIAALVSIGLAYIMRATGLDLSHLSTPLAVAISGFVVAELQNIVNLIPESYDPTVDFVFKVIVLLLGSVGLLAAIKRPRADEPYHPSLLVP